MKQKVLTLFLLLFFLSCTSFEFDNPADRENIDYTAPQLIFVSKGKKAAIKLTWTANQDHIDYYIIYRGTGPDTLSQIARVSSSVTSFTDNNFAPFEKHFYHYAVKAVLTAGEVSGQSNIKTGYIYKTRIPIEDPNLENAVREAIGNGETFIGDAVRLTYLDAAGKDIVKLSGIEHLFLLTKLKLNHNHIVDISPLKKLTRLTELNLAANKISGLGHLSQLTGLTKLNLTDNKITDLAPLLKNEGIGSGDTIILKSNPLGSDAIRVQVPKLKAKRVSIDQTAIIPCTFTDPALEAVVREAIHKPEGKIFFRDVAELTTLSAQGKQIKTLNGLESLTSLTGLYLNQNKISDITPLASLDKLQYLDLIDNRVTDLSPLLDNKGIGRGDTLKLKGNPLNDNALTIQVSTLKKRGADCDSVPILFIDLRLEAAVREAIQKPGGVISYRDIAGLKSLVVNNRSISDLGGIEHLTSLTELNLNYNSISDLTPLLSLKGLTKLELNYNSITDLTPLSPLKALTKLELNHNNISDLTPLSSLSNLIELELRFNRLTDLTTLPSLRALTTLSLGNNQIAELSPLPSLPALKILSLRDASISDLSALVNSKDIGKGDYIVLFKIILSEKARNEQIPALRERGVIVQIYLEV